MPTVELKQGPTVGLNLAINALRFLNDVRPGEQTDPDAERWTILGAAEFLGTTPERVREAMTAAGVVYRLVLDGAGYLDAAGMLAVARWLQVQSNG